MQNLDKLTQIKSLIRQSGYEFSYWELNLETNQFIIDNGFSSVFECASLPNNSRLNWLKNFLGDEDWKKFNEKFDHLAQRYVKLDAELPITLPCKAKKWIRIVGSCSRVDKKIITGSIQNVTNQVSRDAANRDRTIELNSFEKGLDKFSIVARTDHRGKITYANEEFCRLSKYSEEELIGKDHRIINSGLHPKEFFKNMWDTIKSGDNWRGIIRNEAKDGTYYWTDTIIIPIHDSEGVLREFLSFRFDVTNMQKIREENLRLKKEIEVLKGELNKVKV